MSNTPKKAKKQTRPRPAKPAADQPANYSQWVKRDLWTIWQSVSLLVGIEPNPDANKQDVGLETLRSAIVSAPLLAKFNELYEQSKDATRLFEDEPSGKLPTHLPFIKWELGDYLRQRKVKPAVYIKWARHKRWPIPTELVGLAPEGHWYRRDGSPIPGAETIELKQFMQGFKAAPSYPKYIDQLFKGAHSKGSAAPADQYRVYTSPTKEKAVRGVFDRAALLDHCGDKITAKIQPKPKRPSYEEDDDTPPILRTSPAKPGKA